MKNIISINELFKILSNETSFFYVNKKITEKVENLELFFLDKDTVTFKFTFFDEFESIFKKCEELIEILFLTSTYATFIDSEILKFKNFDLYKMLCYVQLKLNKYKFCIKGALTNNNFKIIIFKKDFKNIEQIVQIILDSEISEDEKICKLVDELGMSKFEAKSEVKKHAR